MDRTGGEALAAQLAHEQVTDVFGVPGVQLDSAMDGLAKHTGQIRFITARHEQGAAYMADGYARSSGRPGVFMVVPGPGILNASAALSTAYACSSPVVALIGQIPSRHLGQGRGLLHEIREQSAIVASLTKWSAMAHSPSEIPTLVHEAFTQVRSGRPQPVALELPPDVLAGRADVELIEAAALQHRDEPDADLLGKAAELLRAAARPLIYVGSGVIASGASDQLRKLAELVEAPVVMSSNGRGAISERHPLALNSLAGRRLLAHADVVLAVGSRFITSAGGRVATAADATVILVNTDVTHLAMLPSAALAVHSDAQLCLAALAECLTGAEGRPSRALEVAQARAWAEEQVDAVEPQASWARALRAAMPEDGILVNELTQVGYVARVAYSVYEPRSFLTPGYQGTLGYGFPTAIGAKIANPSKAVVSVTGDGGFGWSLQELSTARMHGVAVAIVVFNDNAFGNVRRTQREEFDARYIGSELVNPDFVALASSFGVRGVRVESPEELTRVLSEALGANQAILIEVPVADMPSGWHLIIDQPPAATVPSL